MNMNDDNKGNCHGVPIDFIRKLTGFFFITVGEKALTNIPLRKMYRLRNNATLTRLYGPMYFELYEYPPYSDKNQ